MGIADRHIEYRDNMRRNRFSMGQPGNALLAVVAINIVVFLLIFFIRVFHLYSHQGMGMEELLYSGMEWFALPAKLTSLSERPWTLLSFMFSQGGVNTFPLLMTMLSNMLWLYAFGYILQDLSGNRFIFPVYIYGSLLAAIFFIAAVYASPVLRPHREMMYLWGSNTGTMAMAVAVTTFSPQYRIFRNVGAGIPVWILTGLFILVNIVSALGTNSAAAFALLGAAVAGFLFVYLLRKGRDTGKWMTDLYEWVNNLFNPDKPARQESVKETIFYNTGNRPPYSKKTVITQQRIDEILDKINQKGYHMLTDEEKNILKKASEE